MRDALELLLLASVSGSVLGLAVILLRRLWRKRTQPALWYYLWVLVALRLLLPLQAPITTIAIPTAPPSPTVLSQAENTWEPPETIAPESPANAAPIPEAPESDVPSPLPSGRAARALRPPQPTAVLFVLWLTVAVGRLLAGAVGTARFTRAIRSAAKDTPQSPRLQRIAGEAAAQVGLASAPAVYALAEIDIPLQIGLHTPSVLLPDREQDDQVLRYILMHEFIHYKRRDVLYKWLVQLMICMHWFNPLVYLFRRQILADCELSCDAGVLHLLEVDEHCAYGEMLLSAAAKPLNRRIPAGSVMLSADAKALKSRLVQIAGYGKRAKPMAAVSVLMAAVLLVCGFVAGPSLEKETAPQSPQRSPLQQLLGVNDPRDIAREFEIYAPFGLTHSLQYNRLYFDGELVRYFEDIESDTSYRRWAMPDGAVDVYAQRDADGRLMGVKKYSQGEYDARTGSIGDYPHAYTHSISVYTYNNDAGSSWNRTETELGQRLPGETDGEYYGRVYGALYGSSDPPQSLKETLAEIYEEYGIYGLTYSPEAHRLYYDGRLVKFFSDLSDGGTGNNRYFGPYPDGEVSVTAQRSPLGVLTGLAVKDAREEDGAGIDWRHFSTQRADSIPSVQTTKAGESRGAMTKSMPLGGAEHIEIIAPTCRLAIEKSMGSAIEAVFTYPDALEPNYTKYVELVIEKPDPTTVLVETRYDDHGFDPVPGMDIEEQMDYQPLLTVRIPDRRYASLSIRLVASARDDIWDLPLDVEADTLHIRSVANYVRFIANASYGNIRIDNYASELYYVTRQTGREMTIENKVGSIYLTLLEEPQNITFDLSEVDAANIPAHWRGKLVNDRYIKGAGQNTVNVANDRGTVHISVQQ